MAKLSYQSLAKFGHLTKRITNLEILKICEITTSHENQWIVKKGLKKGERVIAEGLQKVRPGMEVKIMDAAAKPTS